MSIVSSDAAGAPRLIRAIVPRAVPAGMAPGAAARDHVAALKELWVAQGQTTDLVERSTQPLRNGATVVTLAQEVDGVPVNRGELHVLLHTDGRLAAVSGTLMASAAKPRFVSSSREALGHALDKQYGAARPQPAITEEAAAAGDSRWLADARGRLDSGPAGGECPRAPRAHQDRQRARPCMAGRGHGHRCL